MLRIIPLFILAMALAVLPTACSKDYDCDVGLIGDYSQVLATIVPRDGGYDVVVDSATTLRASASSAVVDRRDEFRAFCAFVSAGNAEVDVLGYDRVPEPPAAPAAMIDADEWPDRIVVSDEWPTLLDDGFLTLAVTVKGNGHTAPESAFCLVTGIDPDDPCAMELRYRALDPGQLTDSRTTLAIDLNDIPGLRDGDILKLSWLSPGGPCLLRLPVRLSPRHKPTPASQR